MYSPPSDSANLDAWFKTIQQLVMHHSPSGVEREVDLLILNHLKVHGEEVWQDRSENIVMKIPGRNSSLAMAITAYKDEIGALVNEVKADGRRSVRRLGGSYPWGIRGGGCRHPRRSPLVLTYS